MLLAAQETADTVYILAADDPIGHLFLAVSFLVIPVLAGVGIYGIAEKNNPIWGQ